MNAKPSYFAWQRAINDAGVFLDGWCADAAETVTKIYDNLDFTHAFEAFVNTMQGVSIESLHRGFRSAGVKDNEASSANRQSALRVAFPRSPCRRVGRRGSSCVVRAETAEQQPSGLCLLTPLGSRTIAPVDK